METELKKAFTWEIDNFSQKTDLINSDTFSSGGCKWYLKVYPKGYCDCDHLSMYLAVSNPESLRLGWKRRASSYFVLLNQSGKEIYTSSESSHLYCAEASNWGYSRMLPHSKFKEDGFLETDKLTIEVYIKVAKVVHEGKSTETDMAVNVGKIFAQHPDYAKDIRPKNKEVKTAYINLLVRLTKTLDKPPNSLSESEVKKAKSELTELMDVGFKLDWLKSKLEEVSLERKKADDEADGSLVQQHEERLKNLELKVSDLKNLELKVTDLEVELEKEKNNSVPRAKVSSLQFIDIINRFFLSCFSISNH